MIYTFFAIDIIGTSIALFITIIIAIKIISEFTTDAPFLEVPDHVLPYMINAMKLNDSSVLYDLGSGNGKVLISAVETNPNINAVGVEVGLIPYYISKFQTRNYKQIKIVRDDFFDSRLENVTHIFLFLSPIVNDLYKLIKHHAEPGTKIVSCDFEIREVSPNEIIEMQLPSGVKRGKKLFVYTV